MVSSLYSLSSPQPHGRNSVDFYDNFTWKLFTGKHIYAHHGSEGDFYAGHLFIVSLGGLTVLTRNFIAVHLELVHKFPTTVLYEPL